MARGGSLLNSVFYGSRVPTASPTSSVNQPGVFVEARAGARRRRPRSMPRRLSLSKSATCLKDAGAAVMDLARQVEWWFLERQPYVPVLRINSAVGRSAREGL